jgi:hypothetical protein
MSSEINLTKEAKYLMLYIWNLNLKIIYISNTSAKLGTVWGWEGERGG